MASVFVYILRCAEETYYVGSTSDVTARVAAHNARKVPHTSKFAAWQIETGVAFRDKAKAVAFAKKHF